MKATPSFAAIAILSAMSFLAGCSGDNSPEAAETPEAASGAIQITGNDTMHFNKENLTVKAGQSVILTFRNVGSMPKAAMGHNWVLLEVGVDPEAFVAAGATHGGTDFIDPATKDEVIIATRILGPGESETLTFTAPENPGTYPYVCSFPGHVAAGMKGVMTVEAP